MHSPKEAQSIIELINPGKRGLSAAWALVFLSIGLFFAIAGPFPYMVILVFPLFAYGFVGFLWDGFYRTPNRINIREDGLELSYRRRKDRFVLWKEIKKLEVPHAPPETLFGKYLSTARLQIEGEKRPYNLTTTSGASIRDVARKIGIMSI